MNGGLGLADAWTEDGTYTLLLRHGSRGTGVLTTFCVERADWTWTGEGWAAGNRRRVSPWFRGRDAREHATEFSAAYVAEHPGNDHRPPDRRAEA